MKQVETEKMNQAVLGLGSNLSFKGMASIDIVRSAIAILKPYAISNFLVSNFYRSSAVPASDQPDFVNATIAFDTDLNATDLLRIAQEVEQSHGRKRGDRWSARTLDIDILAYGHEILPNQSVWDALQVDPDPAAFVEEVTVPHPRLHKRLFMLKPLNDIVPAWGHPCLGLTVREMLLQKEADNHDEVVNIIE